MASKLLQQLLQIAVEYFIIKINLLKKFSSFMYEQKMGRHNLVAILEKKVLQKTKC